MPSLMQVQITIECILLPIVLYVFYTSVRDLWRTFTDGEVDEGRIREDVCQESEAKKVS